jgi:hypothetical protein
MAKPVKLSSLKADLAREKKGDWVAFPDWPGVEFNVSSIHLPEYVAARALLFQRLNVVHKNNIPQDVMTAEIGGLMNTHLLHGWRGFDIEYSAQAAAEVMGDPAFREVVAAVQWCASELGKIEVGFAETETKNSGKPTARA